MESQVKTRTRAGWQEDETTRLFTAVKEASATGAPLRSVFESLSDDLGRKPNSIRNYYYAQTRLRELLHDIEGLHESYKRDGEKQHRLEMTRQREHESIQSQVYIPCPYCSGSGLVKSPVTMSAEIQRKLNSVMRDRKYKGVPLRVFMHPEVLTRLRNEDAHLLNAMEAKYKNALSFRADPMLHYEEFKLVDAVTGVEVK